MPFISIPWTHTANPQDVWTSRSVFAPNDRFAIVMGVNVSSDVIQAGLKFNAVFQLVNPRDDPYDTSWFTILSGDLFGLTTVDYRWENVIFQWGTDFAIWFSWNRYLDAVNNILGGDKDKGIFFARGTIDVQNSNLFAHSPEFWYKVRP
jgi:hypothetical protein